MAFTMGAGWIREALPMPSSDAGADTEMIGSVAYLTVDVTSYTTGGESVTAGEVFMRKIFGAQIEPNENADAMGANRRIPQCKVAADGLTMVVHSGDADDGVETPATTDIGVCNLIVWGEGFGHQEN